MAKKNKIKIVGRFVICTLAAVVLLMTLIYTMQEKLIFLPSTLSQGYTYQFDEPFEEITLTAADGAKLNAIHFKNENPKGVILYFHGNAGDLSRWGIITEYFTQFNYDVLVMDYRTYGKSTGSLSQNALYDDAQLFYDYVAERYSEDQIIVYGRSLGTTFATYVASKNEPEQLILETPFFSLTEVAKKRFPFLPVKKMLRYTFPSKDYIGSVSCPITIFHGTADNVVPYKSGVRLSKKVREGLLKFVTLENGQHNNLIEYDLYHTEIKKLLQ